MSFHLNGNTVNFYRVGGNRLHAFFYILISHESVTIKFKKLSELFGWLTKQKTSSRYFKMFVKQILHAWPGSYTVTKTMSSNYRPTFPQRAKKFVGINELRIIELILLSECSRDQKNCSNYRVFELMSVDCS